MAIKVKTVQKSKGRVYTPRYIVTDILDMAQYCGEAILKKHVIDNSCGDGVFLCEIADRYCNVAVRCHISERELKNQLETYIHGIEIDPTERQKCLENLNLIASKYGITSGIEWDILCADALNVEKYDGKMDFVLGNPPYIRVHNLEDDFQRVKKFSFAQGGMTDLYIVFYEIGLKMLNSTGVLGYITPSSFFNSLAGNCMRQHFVQEKLIRKILDLKHYQAFCATTYTAIVILSKNHRTDQMEYYQFDEIRQKPYYVETLTSNDYYIAQNFYFSTRKNLDLLKKVFFNVQHCDVKVKNGYATLQDNTFVGTFDFHSKYIIPVIKASRGEYKKIIFPYDENGILVSEEDLAKDEVLYRYLVDRKESLLHRSLENSSKAVWYSFGRSQAIGDTYKEKLSVNALIRTSKDLKIISAPAGTGVYGGLYLTGNSDDLKKAKEDLLSEEFSDYVSLLGKYKSGGYYTFSSKDLKAYLDYKFSE